MFWDAAVVSSHAKPPADAPNDAIPVHVTFLDWTTGICSTLGLLVVNLINKEHLLSEGGYSQDQAIVWRARLFLFIGFAFMAGGLAGSVVRIAVIWFLSSACLFGSSSNVYRLSWFSNTFSSIMRTNSSIMDTRMLSRMWL